MLDFLPFPKIDGENSEKKFAQINNYLIQLKEAIEFALGSMSSENKSMSDALTKNLNASNEERTDELTQVSSKISKDNDRVMSLIEQTAEEIRTEVKEEYELKTDSNEMYKELSSSIEQTKDSINISVTETFKDYSTTEQMKSEIKASADAIGLEVSKKVGEDEVCAKISLDNAGDIDIKGNRISITSDNFHLSKEGDITAKNANVTGEFSQVDSNGKQAIKIKNNNIDFHNWTNEGEYVGSIFTAKNSSSDDVGINISVEEGNNITLAIIKDNVHVPVFQVNGDTYETAPPWIKNTVNGTLFPRNAGGGISVKNGLITDWNLNTSTGTITIEGISETVKIIVENGLIRSWSYQ